MRRRDFLVSGTAVGLGAATGYAVGRETSPTPSPPPSESVSEENYGKKRRPNFVVLVADDMRWDCMGVANNRFVKTPNLDRLAQTSVVFQNAFVTTSICPTSRASILLGNYASTHDIWDFRTPLSPGQMQASYPVQLRENGYRTGFVGKWGLGGGAPEQEFDFFDGFENLGHYFDPSRGVKHLTAHNGDRATDFIKSSSSDQPYCLIVSFWAPHSQNNQPENEVPFDPADASLYQGGPIPMAETFSATFAEGLPGFLHEKWAETQFNRRFTVPEDQQKFVKGYYRLISGMDRAIGRILATIEAEGEADNTIILFLSDNGYMLGEHGFAGKWLIYEESIRIPLMISYPKHFRHTAGVRTDTALNIDVAPTILSAAGIPYPAGYEGQDLMAPRTPGDDGAENMFFYEYKLAPFTCVGVRTPQWKYVLYPTENVEWLFDHSVDPLEINNLAGQSRFSDEQATLRDMVIERYRDTPLLET